MNRPTRVLLGLLICLAAPLTSGAQSLDGPLKIVVGYPPGGSSDRAARLLVEPLRERLGVPVIVENKTGAGGRLSAQSVRGTPSDQNVLLMGNPAINVVAPLMIDNPGYDPIKDFVPDLPTLKESNLDVVADGWSILFAPASMPPTKVALIGNAIEAAMKAPDLQARFRGASMDPVAASPAETARRLDAYRAKWEPVIKASGIRN